MCQHLENVSAPCSQQIVEESPLLCRVFGRFQHIPNKVVSPRLARIFKQIVTITATNGLSTNQVSVHVADDASVFQIQQLTRVVKCSCKCHIITSTVKAANCILVASGCDKGPLFVLKMYSEIDCSE